MTKQSKLTHRIQCLGWKRWLLAKLGKYDEAIKAYDKAIEINPQDSKAWYGKGAVLGLSSKYNEAIKAFDKAIEINPQDSMSWDGKGFALNKLSKSNEAIKAHEKAIEIDSQLRSLAQ